MPYIIRFGSTESVNNKPIRVTTNLQAMLTHALGFKPEEMDNTIAMLAYDSVARSVKRIFDPRMEVDFDKMLPENNFGNLNDAREFLLTVMVRIANFPEAVMYVTAEEQGKVTKHQYVPQKQIQHGSVAQG